MTDLGFFAAGFVTLAIVGVACTVIIVKAVDRFTLIATTILNILCGDTNAALRILQGARRQMPPPVHRGSPPPAQTALYRDRRPR